MASGGMPLNLQQRELKRFLCSAGSKAFHFRLVLVSFLATAAVPLRAGFSWHPVDVMTITDMKPAGKKFPLPTKEHPIYYEAINAGYKDWGRIIAGDKEPKVKLMQDTVVRALARNHYLSADSKHVATEIIVMSWGTMYTGGGLSLGESPALQFLAGDKYLDGVDRMDVGSLGFTTSVSRAVPVLSQSKLHDYASGDLYLALLRAYSTRDANKGEIVELWETRIACPSAGLELESTLPTMVKLAAPHIGVDMPNAVFTTPEKSQREDIEFGDLKVLDDIDVNAAHVTPINDLVNEAKATRIEKTTTKPASGVKGSSAPTKSQ